MELRRALIDLGIGLWLTDPAAKAYAARPACPRQEGRRHRLRDGAPRQPDRFAWSATRPATTRPAGPEHTRRLPRSRPISPPATQRSTWSARSAARTNDVDRDEPGGTSCGSEEQPRRLHARKEAASSHFTTPADACHAGTDEGPDQTPTGLWRTPQRVTPSLAWRPALRHQQQPERRQMTTPPRSHKSAWAPANRRNSQHNPDHTRPPTKDAGAAEPCPPTALTGPTAS